jgi:hypothetical protein
MDDKEEWRWVCVDAGSRLDDDSDEEEEEEDEEYDPTRLDEDGLLRPLTRWGQTLACLPSSSSSTALSFFLYGGTLHLRTLVTFLYFHFHFHFHFSVFGFNVIN